MWSLLKEDSYVLVLYDKLECNVDTSKFNDEKTDEFISDLSKLLKLRKS